MATEQRHVGISKKVSLSEFSEGWDECYALVRPASWDELMEVTESDDKGLTPKQKMQGQFATVKSHVIGGRIKVLNKQSGENELVELKAEDLKAAPMALAKVYREIMGLNLSPKETTPAES